MVFIFPEPEALFAQWKSPFTKFSIHTIHITPYQFTLVCWSIGSPQLAFGPLIRAYKKNKRLATFFKQTKQCHFYY